MDSNSKKVGLSVKDLINLTLGSFNIGIHRMNEFPVFSYQNKKSLGYREKKLKFPESIRYLLDSKKIPQDSRADSKFKPYYKAAQTIKILKYRFKDTTEFDLANIKHKEFTDNCYSLNDLVRSTSPLRVSRLSPTPKRTDRSQEWDSRGSPLVTRSVLKFPKEPTFEEFRRMSSGNQHQFKRLEKPYTRRSFFRTRANN